MLELTDISGTRVAICESLEHVQRIVAKDGLIGFSIWGKNEWDGLDQFSAVVSLGRVN